jgi:hypothetical protein
MMSLGRHRHLATDRWIPHEFAWLDATGEPLLLEQGVDWTASAEGGGVLLAGSGTSMTGTAVSPMLG